MAGGEPDFPGSDRRSRSRNHEVQEGIAGSTGYEQQSPALQRNSNCNLQMCPTQFHEIHTGTNTIHLM